MEYKLDKYDIALIKYCKSERPTIQGVRELRAKECACSLQIVNNAHLAESMLNLAINLNLTPIKQLMTDILHGTRENEQWKYGFEGETDCNITNHYYNWIRVLGSKLRLAPVSELPGY